MELLENIYDNPPLITDTHSRKIQINHKKTFIFGPRFCGKTYLIFDYIKANNITNFLYIDLADFRHKKVDGALLDEFILEEEIDLVIIENYNEDFVLPKAKMRGAGHKSTEEIYYLHTFPH